MICRESLAIPRGCMPLNFSRINQDTTPFQYSLTLGAGSEPPLQFLSEAAIPGSSNGDRLLLSKERICALADLFGARNALSEVTNLFDEIVPARDPDLLADHSGAIWIGASFSPEEEPRLKIYLNVKWGSEMKRWARLNVLASHFDAATRWREIERLLMHAMQPHGVALTLSKDQRAAGRIYLSAYGHRVSFYENLAWSVGGRPLQRLLSQYVDCLLREDSQYPTLSTVCSFGFDGTRSEPDYKWETCGHCMFASDLEGRERCLDCLNHFKVDPNAYLTMLEVLSEGHLSDTAPQLHSYVGVGSKRGQVYFTFYFKPSLG
jgi:hypothetical protein